VIVVLELFAGFEVASANCGCELVVINEFLALIGPATFIWVKR
tara:strand:- start:586 stop:714 length:129 start_codon:yes stop_codon:yes gene_type:complete